MTDLQHPIPEPQQETPSSANEGVSQQIKKPNKKLWVIAGGVASLICLCTTICVVAVALGVGKGMVERKPVESVLDSYMRYMVAKDIENAYALFSPRAQRQIPLSQLEELVEGNNYVIFEGYQSLSVQSLQLSTGASTNPDTPQGNLAIVTGIISYEDNFQGNFNGVLEKVNGEWQIDGIHVTVPPNKLQP